MEGPCLNAFRSAVGRAYPPISACTLSPFQQGVNGGSAPQRITDSPLLQPDESSAARLSVTTVYPLTVDDNSKAWSLLARHSGLLSRKPS